jgi:pSer/pThr/pTyr-binding forkhead associated (FHA) protein
VVNGTRHPLTPPGLVIGRGAEADLRINDPGVSRRHAEFRVSAGRDGQPEVSVADLGSTNGTLLDGQRIRGESSLRDGSVVRVGNTDVSVHFAGGGG